MSDLQKGRVYIVIKPWPGVTINSVIEENNYNEVWECENGSELEKEHIDKAIKDGLIKAKTSQWMFSEEDIKFNKNSIEIGCTNILINHLEYINSILNDKPFEISKDFVKKANKNSSYKFLETTYYIIEALKDLPLIEKGSKFYLRAEFNNKQELVFNIELDSGNLSFNHTQLKILEKEGWISLKTDNKKLELYHNHILVLITIEDDSIIIDDYTIDITLFKEFYKEAQEFYKK